MLRNANKPKNTAMAQGSTMMTRTTQPRGSPGASIAYQRMVALTLPPEGETAGATCTVLVSPELR